MGMYDTVIGECPECTGLVSFQSKAGPCMLDIYGVSAVPEKIALSLARGEGYPETKCERCGTVVRFTVPKPDEARSLIVLNAVTA